MSKIAQVVVGRASQSTNWESLGEFSDGLKSSAPLKGQRMANECRETEHLAKYQINQ